MVEDYDVVDGLSRLRQEMTRYEHGATGVRLITQETAQPVHSFGVEPVSGLIEDQYRRVAQERSRQTEALTHSQREPADATAGMLGETHLVEGGDGALFGQIGR